MKRIEVKFQKDGMAPHYVDDLSNVMIEYNGLDESIFEEVRMTQERYKNTSDAELEALLEEMLMEAFGQEAEIVEEKFMEVEGKKDDYWYWAVGYCEVRLPILPNHVFECKYEIDEKMSNLKGTENYIDKLIEAENYVAKSSDD